MFASIGRTGRFAGSVALATAVSVLLVAGCTDEDDEEPSSSPDRLRIGFNAPPASLDFTQDDGAAIPEALLVNVYEGLVKVDEYGSLVPLLAEDWSVSEDRTVYTFDLVDDATFSDGSRFTAEDAVFSIEQVQTAWEPAVKAGMDVVEDAEAVDETTLEVTLERPSNLWLYQMSTRIGAMFPKGDLEDLDTDPIGTGPYVMAEYNEGEWLDLERRDDYWGEDPEIPEVRLKYINDPDELNEALRDGDLDLISNVQAPENLSMFSNELKYRITEGSTNSEVLLAYNNEQEPLDELSVRKALKYAVDRREVRDNAWAGRGQLIGSMVAPTDPWYEDLSNEYPHDPERARKLLREAGYGPGDVTLRLRVPELPYATASAEVVEEQLEDVGINVELDILAFPDDWLPEVFDEADYHLSIISHVEPWDMPVLFGDPDYYLRYDNPDFRDLLEKADAGSREEQIQKMKEAGRMLSDDAASDFLFLLPSLKVSDRRVEGVPTNTVSEAFDVTILSLDSTGMS